MRILSIDQSTKRVGWARWGPDLPDPVSSSWVPQPVSVKDDQPDYGSLYAELWQWLDDMHEVHDFEVVAQEAPMMAPHDNLDRLRKLLGLATVTALWANRAGLTFWEPTHGEHMRSLTGRGRWPKGESKKAVMRFCQMQAWNPANDDEADALSILYHVLLMERVRMPWRDRPLMAVPLL